MSSKAKLFESDHMLIVGSNDLEKNNTGWSINGNTTIVFKNIELFTIDGSGISYNSEYGTLFCKNAIIRIQKLDDGKKEGKS